jgi:uncharacterized protein
VDAIEYLSGLLMEFCASNEVRFSGHMVTNGTCRPSAPHECVSFVKRHKIKHIQLSFDGLAENHNKRRHYLEKHPDRPSSFDALCRTVDSLVGHANLYLRINMDRVTSLTPIHWWTSFMREDGCIRAPKCFLMLPPCSRILRHALLL